MVLLLLLYGLVIGYLVRPKIDEWVGRVLAVERAMVRPQLEAV